MEEWKLAPMNEPHYGNYWVSNLGRVKNSKGRILKGGFNTKGYPHVCVKLEGVQSTYKVHRLVAMAFIPNPDNLPQVNHIDGDKTNNAVSNLEWCDNGHNQRHKLATGLYVPPKGNDSYVNKLTEEQVIEIYKSNLTQKELSEIYGVSRSTIGHIKLGLNWSWLTKDLRKDDENGKRENN